MQRPAQKTPPHPEQVLGIKTFIELPMIREHMVPTSAPARARSNQSCA
jgi:hypothetical protein